MKEVKEIACQGDVLVRKVGSIPESFKEVTGRMVVAHSETGHDHVIDDNPGAKLFRDPANPNVCYLRLEGADHADLVHHRDYHTHETLRLLGEKSGFTIFECKRQQEMTPAGWRQVQD